MEKQPNLPSCQLDRWQREQPNLPSCKDQDRQQEQEQEKEKQHPKTIGIFDWLW